MAVPDQDQAQQPQQNQRVQQLVKAAAAGYAAKQAADTAAVSVTLPAGVVAAPVTVPASAFVHGVKAAVIIAALRKILKRQHAESADWLTKQLTRQFPNADPAAIRQAVEQELAFERVFQAKSLKRVQDDLHAAGALPTAEARQQRVNAILSREQHYAGLREQALLSRATATVQNSIIKQQSPGGAVWMLGDRKTHTRGCFPGYVLAGGPQPTNASCRPYTGKLLEVVVTSGQVLPVTPNHPILTRRGWVAAKELRSGDQLVSDSGADRQGSTSVAPRTPEDNDDVRNLAQVFQSLEKAIPESAVTHSVEPLDFHGDVAGKANVRVVGAYRNLRYMLRLAALAQQEHEHEFFFRDPMLASGTCSSSADTVSIGLMLSAAGGGRATVSVLNSEALLFGHGAEREPDGFGPPTPNRDPRFEKVTLERMARDASLLGKSLDGLTGKVTFCKVIEVRDREFCAHVYNLETDGGWYTANGIVVANCLALAGKAWPWSVLDAISPPIHAGCGCILRPLAPGETPPAAGEALNMARAALALEEAVRAVADPGEIDAYLAGQQVRPSIARALELEEADWKEFLHPRGRGGKWIDKLAGLGPRREPEHEAPRAPSVPKPTFMPELSPGSTVVKGTAPAENIIGGDVPAPARQGPIPDFRHLALKLKLPPAFGADAIRAKAGDQDYLVKDHNGDRNRVASELLANAVYRTLGIDTPTMGHIQTAPEPDFSKRPDDLPNEPPIDAPPHARISTGVVLREPDGRLTVIEPRNHYGGYIHCVPLDTRILTRTGFKGHDEVQVGDETIGFDPVTGRNRWTPITAVCHFPEAPLVRYGTMKWSVLCTAEHDWLVVRDGIVTKSPAHRRLREGEHLLLSMPHDEGDDVDVTAAALLGWIVTDGNLEGASGGARIAQTKPKGKAALELLLERVDHAVAVGGYRLPAHVLRDVKEFTGWSGEDSDLPDVVLRMGPQALAAFYAAAYMAEGDMDHRRRRLWQNAGPTCDALAIAAYRLGYAPTVRSHGGRILQKIAVNRSLISWKRVKALAEGTAPIWCVQTGLGTWTMEQDGRIALTGNTFPKGGVEENLTPQQNAHKELWEETGLHAHITGVVGDFKGDTGTSRYYLGVRTGGEAAPSDETEAIKTVTPDEAAQMLNRQRDQDVLKAVLEQPVPEGDFEDQFPPEQPGSALAFQAVGGKTKNITEPNDALSAGYMADALLGNRNFLGQRGENIRWRDDDTPVRVNMGSVFGYGQGGAGSEYGDVPDDIWTMRYRGQAAGTITRNEDALRKQAADIARTLTDAKIDKLAAAAPFPDDKERKRIADTLKQRVAWMRRFANGEEHLPQPAEGAEARVMFADAQDGFDIYPEEDQALEEYATKAGRALDNHLRSGKADDLTDADRKIAKRLDAVLEASDAPTDSYVYLGAEAAPGRDMVGKTFSMKSYIRAHTDATKAKGNTRIRLLVPGGGRAWHLQDAEPGEPDMLLPRDQRLLVTGMRTDPDGAQALEAMALPYQRPRALPSAKPQQSSFGYGGYTPPSQTPFFKKGDRVDINGNKATVTGDAGKGMANVKLDSGKGYTVPFNTLKRLEEANIREASREFEEWLHPRGRGGEWIRKFDTSELRSEKAKQDVEAAQRAIEQATGRPAFPLKITRLPDEDAATARSLPGGRIAIQDTGSRFNRSAIVHEAAHSLDRMRHEGEWLTQADEAEPLRKALWGSPTVKRIENGEVEILKDEPNVRRDILNSRELFARAFEQYVATRSDDDALKQDLRSTQADPYLSFLRWPDDEFEPIAREMDKLFGHEQGTEITGAVMTAARAGGGTLDPSTGASVTTGVAVALEGHSSITKAEDWFGDDANAKQIFKDWLKQNADLFKNPNVKVGVWHDTEHGEVVLDPSEVVQSREEAIRLGQERNQQSVYDIGAGEEIPTGGTGGRAEEAWSTDESQLRRRRRLDVGGGGGGDPNGLEGFSQRPHAFRDCSFGSGVPIRMAPGEPDAHGFAPDGEVGGFSGAEWVGVEQPDKSTTLSLRPDVPGSDIGGGGSNFGAHAADACFSGDSVEDGAIIESERKLEATDERGVYAPDDEAAFAVDKSGKPVAEGVIHEGHGTLVGAGEEIPTGGTGGRPEEAAYDDRLEEAGRRHDRGRAGPAGRARAEAGAGERAAAAEALDEAGRWTEVLHPRGRGGRWIEKLGAQGAFEEVPESHGLVSETHPAHTLAASVVGEKWDPWTGHLKLAREGYRETVTPSRTAGNLTYRSHTQGADITLDTDAGEVIRDARAEIHSPLPDSDPDLTGLDPDSATARLRDAGYERSGTVNENGDEWLQFVHPQTGQGRALRLDDLEAGVAVGKTDAFRPTGGELWAAKQREMQRDPFSHIQPGDDADPIVNALHTSDSGWKLAGSYDKNETPAPEGVDGVTRFTKQGTPPDALVLHMRSEDGKLKIVSAGHGSIKDDADPATILTDEQHTKEIADWLAARAQADKQAAEKAARKQAITDAITNRDPVALKQAYADGEHTANHFRMDMKKWGLATRIGSAKSGEDTVHTFRTKARDTITLTAGKWGQVKDVQITPQNRTRQPQGTYPKNLDDLFADALGRADELGERHHTGVNCADVEIGGVSKGAAGMHGWDGVIHIRRKDAEQMADFLAKHAAGEPLTDDDRLAFYNNLETLQHEVIHGVGVGGGIKASYYNGMGKNVEEALTEDLSHLETADWLRSYGMTDVLQAVKRYPDDYRVLGTYGRYRLQLKGIIDGAGIPAEQRGELLRQLKYQTQPEEQYQRLIDLARQARPKVNTLKGAMAQKGTGSAGAPLKVKPVARPDLSDIDAPPPTLQGKDGAVLRPGDAVQGIWRRSWSEEPGLHTGILTEIHPKGDRVRVTDEQGVQHTFLQQGDLRNPDAFQSLTAAEAAPAPAPAPSPTSWGNLHVGDLVLAGQNKLQFKITADNGATWQVTSIADGSSMPVPKYSSLPVSVLTAAEPSKKIGLQATPLAEMPVSPFLWRKGGAGHINVPLSGLKPGDRFRDRDGRRYTVIYPNPGGSAQTSVLPDTGERVNVPHYYRNAKGQRTPTRVRKLDPAPVLPRDAAHIKAMLAAEQWMKASEITPAKRAQAHRDVAKALAVSGGKATPGKLYLAAFDQPNPFGWKDKLRTALTNAGVSVG